MLPAVPAAHVWARFLDRFFRRGDQLDRAMLELERQLGLSAGAEQRSNHHEVTLKRLTKDLARAVFYAPDMDGQAEPGEVVFSPLRFSRNDEVEQRAVLIIGRNHHTLLALLISSNPDHADEQNWLHIGNGPWDPQHVDSWVRLDKTLLISESLIRRQGIRLPERRFERLAGRLRSDYGWK